MMKILSILHLISTVKGSFHLYNTKVSDNLNYKDCLYSFTSNTTIYEWQLVPYCIRLNLQTPDDDGNQCVGEAQYTFEQLKWKNVSCHQLYEWNAPIDMINDYEKYLAGDDRSLASQHYCNCSANLFGTRCEYSFDETNETMTFNEIITFQFQRKRSLQDHYEIVNDSSMLTCYDGLQCHSAICLDWRHICDRTIHCENVEDEPDVCLLLELNECKKDEYRCRHGACIPKTFLLDFSYDCMDLSDERDVNRDTYGDPDCYVSPTLLCDFRLHEAAKFPCRDGEIISLYPHQKSCNNGHDLFLRRNVLLSDLSQDGNSSTTISSECWVFMLCEADAKYLQLFGHNSSICYCLNDSVTPSQCREYFQKHCSTSFVFQTAWNPLYPFIRFLYRHTPGPFGQRLAPSHACYNESHCPVFPLSGLPLMNGLLCITISSERGRFVSNQDLQMLFSACSIPSTASLANDSRLFYCNASKKLISKHRIEDTYIDCYYMGDSFRTDLSDQTLLDDALASFMRDLNLTDRFKCATTDQWLLRIHMDTLEDGCADKSDTLYLGTCKIGSDLGCQFLRGLYSLPVHYVFQENCNAVLKMDLRLSIENETDETSCEEWPSIRCNGHWNLVNGEDELDCPNTISSYLTHTIFNCSVNEHYCADQKTGKMGCLTKERAGDGIFDCLGRTDERMTSCAFKYPNAPFYCENFMIAGDVCIVLSDLCNADTNYCHDRANKLMCPWIWHSLCDMDTFFVCENGDCITRKKQCDNVIDCHPSGEDEWFCDLSAERRIPQFSLNDIDSYPAMIGSRQSAGVTNLHSSASLPVYNIPLRKNVNPLDDWFCNRGIIIKKRSSTMVCLCPPTYYGPRCQYQSERVLITVRIDTLASLGGYRNEQNAIRLLAYLMLDDVIVHHEQILHARMMKHIFYLNYPQPPPKPRGNWSVRLDAFSTTTSNVDYKASWLFDVPFSFLPVNRLVLHLTLDHQETCNTLHCAHGSCKKYMNAPYREYCQCEETWSGGHCDVAAHCSCARGGKCISGICVCPLGRMGRECRASFDPCSSITCLNGGRCVPLDERQIRQFTCSCRTGYYGLHCEHADAYVDIHFSPSIHDHSHTLSAALFVHFLELDDESPGIVITQNRQLYQQLSLNHPLRAFNYGQKYLSAFVLLQTIFEPTHVNYYIAAIVKNQQTSIVTTIYKWNRLPHVDELLLNETVRAFSPMKKVKYYHRACKVSNTSNWFHDEAFLCFCDRDRRPDCLFFKREEIHCIKDYCQKNGRCVRNDFNGVWDFGCVCSGCAYGSLCQLTTSQYTLSLDLLLGQDILQNVSLTAQPLFIKIVLIVLLLMLLIGFVSNVLSLCTFKQPKVQEFGCGVYLLCMSVVGQLGLVVLVGRFFYLLSTQLSSVTDRSAAHWSCIGLEYFLTVCSTLFDWFTACVAVERGTNMIKGASFKRSDSVWWAKRIVFLLVVFVLANAWYERFIHQLIDDPRATKLNTWCVVVFPWQWLRYYRLTIILINLTVPCSINLIVTIFLLNKSTQMKQAFIVKKSERKYFTIFKKQLPLYGSPFGLITLSLIRLIFSFTLICITHRWQKYIYLTAYFVSFMPMMGTFPIYVLPSKIYKTEYKNFVQRMKTNLRRPQT